MTRRDSGCRLVIGLWLGLTGAACTVTSAGDDDSAASTPAVIELASGEGFDLNTLTKVTGIKHYDEQYDVDRLVWPDTVPCDDLHGGDAVYPTVCGMVWHNTASKQYDTFADAYRALKNVEHPDLTQDYFAWSLQDVEDVHWGVVLGNGQSPLTSYVFWLEEMTAEGKFRFYYQEAQVTEVLE